MADAKISALIAGGAALSTDLIPIARIGTPDANFSITVGAIATLVLGLVPAPPTPGGVSGAVQFNNSGSFGGTGSTTAGVLISGTTLQLNNGLGDSTGTFASPFVGAAGEFLASTGAATKWRWIPFYDANGDIAVGNDDHIASGTAQLPGDQGSPSYTNNVTVTLTSNSIFADTNYVVQLTRIPTQWKMVGSLFSGNPFKIGQIVGQTGTGASGEILAPFPDSGTGTLYIGGLSGTPNSVGHWSATSPDLGTSVFAPSAPSIPTVNIFAGYNIVFAANASGGTTVYTGFSPTGNESVNAYAGYTFTVSGFVTNPANNGIFFCVASTPTTITLANPNGVAESSAFNEIVNGNMTGTFFVSETVVQSGATASLIMAVPPTNYGAGAELYLGPITGTPTAGGRWNTSPTSGNFFDPSEAPTSMVCSAVMTPAVSGIYVKVISASTFTIYSDLPADTTVLNWTAIGYGVPGGSPV
jgi:hypothetical protein